MKKLFGEINLTWKKLIIFSMLAGVYTALMAIIPALKYTSFNTITTTFEVWIFFGILIIMNSKSNKDAALKCFVFFLISQPLIYLLQVPFSYQGWNLFGYYKYWFIWTILCLPMGYIGYYMKKDKWWGYLILLPMILMVADEYSRYLSSFMFSYPKYLLISLFCAVTMIIYPLYIFKNKKIKTVGVIISSVLIIVMTILCFIDHPVYSTDVLSNGKENKFDNTYKAYLTDSKYGEVKIIYEQSIETYMVHADFKKEGKTNMIIESPNGDKVEYTIEIKKDTYKINKNNKKEKSDNMNKISVIINNNNYILNLENNETVKEFIKVLPKEFNMKELNGNEKYIYLDSSLPTNSYNPKQINKGDVMLFGDNCLVIFYKSFNTSYSYTKIGHIDNMPSLDNTNINIKFELYNNKLSY